MPKSKTVNKMTFPTYSECEIAIRNLKSISSNKYTKAFSNDELDNRLHLQQQLLKNCILSNGTQDFFNVFNMGCSTGKTYVAVNSMPYYLQNVSLGHIKEEGVLFVIRQTEECDKYVDSLNSLFINDDIGNYKKVAMAYHSKKYTNNGVVDEEERKKLLAMVECYPILFITHENYIRLAEDKKARETFTKNRRLLIIDESIDICEIVQFGNIKVEKNENIVCLNELEELQKDLEDDDKLLFRDIVEPLLIKFIEISKEKEGRERTYNFKIKHTQYNMQIENFIKKIIPKYNNSLQKKLKNILKIIGLIYNDTCLINKRSKQEDKNGEEKIYIKTINRNKKMWTLKNNIILDASAFLEPKYKLNPKLYFLMNNENTLDYSKWHIEYILASSTKYAKGIGIKHRSSKQQKRYNMFLAGCSEIIDDLGIDNVLVVCHKDEHITTNPITEEDVPFNPYRSVDIPLNNIAHFGNITGKREFENLQNVLIAHTPNYENSDYILQYMYYADRRYADNETFEEKPVKGLGLIHIFDNQELQDFKERIIANHIYQAVCRVNRNMEHETTVFIISRYLGSILYVRDMLNCKCFPNNDYNKHFEVGKNQVNEDRKEKGKATKLKNLFTEFLKGNIKDYDIGYIQISPNIIKVKKEDIKNLLMFDDSQFNKAKSTNDKFISNHSIICCRDYYYFILDMT